MSLNWFRNVAFQARSNVLKNSLHSMHQKFFEIVWFALVLNASFIAKREEKISKPYWLPSQFQ